MSFSAARGAAPPGGYCRAFSAFKTCSTGSCNCPLVAKASFPQTVGSPRQSVNWPPASWRMGSIGAMSQGLIAESSMTSARPVATRTYP